MDVFDMVPAEKLADQCFDAVTKFLRVQARRAPEPLPVPEAKPETDSASDEDTEESED